MQLSNASMRKFKVLLRWNTLSSSYQRVFRNGPNRLDGSDFQDQEMDRPTSTQLSMTQDKTHRVFGTVNQIWYPGRLLQSEIQNLLIAIIVLLAIFVVAPRTFHRSLCYLAPAPFQSRMSCSRSHWPSRQKFSFHKLEHILQSEPNAMKVAEWNHYYTSQSHFAGEGKDQGFWTKTKWEEFGIPHTEIVSYNAFVGVPLTQRLALLETLENKEFPPKVIYEASLMEDMPQDEPSRIRTAAFMGGSFSGNVTAQFIYANFGLPEDYDSLEEANVDFKGKIAVVKYGRAFRGQKVSTAVARGIVGIVLYTDPQQDGNITEANGYKAYPDGPARPRSYIERGSIKRFGKRLSQC